MTEITTTLTDVELEIMHEIWELGPCTVRQVYEVLRERKKLAYTTVMTMMKILEEKGHLVRHKEGRAFVYQPVRAKGAVISGLVEDFVSKVFRGSARPLIVSLMEDSRISAKDLEEIAKLVEEAE